VELAETSGARPRKNSGRFCGTPISIRADAGASREAPGALPSHREIFFYPAIGQPHPDDFMVASALGAGVVGSAAGSQTDRASPGRREACTPANKWFPAFQRMIARSVHAVSLQWIFSTIELERKWKTSRSDPKQSFPDSTREVQADLAPVTVAVLIDEVVERQVRPSRAAQGRLSPCSTSGEGISSTSVRIPQTARHAGDSSLSRSRSGWFTASSPSPIQRGVFLTQHRAGGWRSLPPMAVAFDESHFDPKLHHARENSPS